MVPHTIWGETAIHSDRGVTLLYFVAFYFEESLINQLPIHDGFSTPAQNHLA